MKRLYFLLCVIVMCIMSYFNVFAQEEISVYLNDKELYFDVAPRIIDGRTMVPMRSVFENLGAEVLWYEDTGIIMGKKNDSTIIMQIDDKLLVSDNEVIKLDVAPLVVNDRTLVPLRAVAESLNVNVEWDETKNRVIITDKNEKTNINSAELGNELASANGWTIDGWLGSFDEGFKHIIGETTPIVYDMPENTGTNLYQIEFDVTDCSAASSPNASTAFSVTIGNSDPFITYNGGGPKHYSFGIQSKENGDLKIILTHPADPFKTEGSFDGTIKNISIKRIIGAYEPSVKITDINDNVNLEIRSNTKDNVYIGNDAGSFNTTGELNVGIGKNSLKNNTSGYWNTAIGALTLEKNTVGSRNVAIGRLALNNNISGDRNYAIGTFALARNTTGRFNIAVGADALWVNTIGNRNIAIGSASQASVSKSNDNISIGQNSMAEKTSGDNNIAIGSYSQYYDSTGNNNISIGSHSQYKGGGNGNNISIGHASGNKMTTIKDETGKITDGANSNVSVGYSTLSNTTTGKYNVSIGHMSGYGNTTSNNNVYVGFYSGNKATGGSNTFIGANSGNQTTIGTNNITLGYGTNLPTPESSHQLNIGNAIFGDLTNNLIGIAKENNGSFKAHLDIGASTGKYPPLALTAGQNTEQLVDGALEYDGQNLYFTKNGVREKVMFESDVKKLIEEILNEK